METKVIIELKGGLVENVFSTAQLQYIIIDFDNQEGAPWVSGCRSPDDIKPDLASLYQDKKITDDLEWPDDKIASYLQRVEGNHPEHSISDTPFQEEHYTIAIVAMALTDNFHDDLCDAAQQGYTGELEILYAWAREYLKERGEDCMQGDWLEGVKDWGIERLARFKREEK